MEARRELAGVSGRERPWLLLADRHALAEAIQAGARLADATVDVGSALALVDGRAPDADRPPDPAAVAAARGWHETLRFLAPAADADGPAPVDEGLVRALHWLLHRHTSGAQAGQVRSGAVSDLPPPPPGGDAIDAAIWTAAALRRAEPCRSGNAAVAFAVELLLLAQADGLAPWLAGRPSPAGDPRELLHATAVGHLRRLREAEQRWFVVAGLLAGAGLADRMLAPCWDAATGLPLANTSYRSATAVLRRRPVSEQQASRDLRALVDAGLLQARGRTRDRTYRWSA